MAKKISAGGISVGVIIGTFIAALVGVVLLDPFGDQVILTTNVSISNVTGAANTIVTLMPLFFALIVAFVLIVKFKGRK